ncbi:MAG: hypothetical protein D8M58_14100 [Calditrichaeota bacterium]|nr:MAG: hypothetical protein DWQ03_15340 [Calditrichota bacterium]MBL1206532.1 hypothetical protein [Calditrichota bacterium]NOG46359.1 hypothetical protein [Calditrichota bacterium]
MPIRYSTYIRKTKSYLIVLVIFHFFSNSFGQDKNYYFYHPDIKIGSETTFNPLSVILNGGFDILRNGKSSKNISNQHYKIGIENVFQNLSHPLKNINRFGWRRFLTSEVFPVSSKSEDFQYFPNYGNHMIGHGMKYVRLSEWFDYHNYSYPKTYAFLTSMTYAYLNEVIENGNNRHINVDPIADMLIFNPLGILLFNTNWAKTFFSKTLPLYDWSLQPVYNPLNNHLENTGEQYVLNYRLTANYSLFFYWGTSGIFGVTSALEDGYNLSFGAGGIVNRLIEKHKIRSGFWTRYVAPETIDGALGVFYDYKHSLLYSLIVTGPIYYNARLNIYPGFLKYKNFSPGIFVGAGELDSFQFGITFAGFPLGLETKI